jgi:hypothetical protein
MIAISQNLNYCSPSSSLQTCHGVREPFAVTCLFIAYDDTDASMIDCFDANSSRSAYGRWIVFSSYFGSSILLFSIVTKISAQLQI